MLNPYRHYLARWAFGFAVAASVVILFTPAEGVPTAPAGTDKVVHFLLFFALAFTGRAAGIRSVGLLVMLCCYAIGSEIAQALLPLGRTADLADAIMDVVGMTAGWALTVAVRQARIF